MIGLVAAGLHPGLQGVADLGVDGFKDWWWRSTPTWMQGAVTLLGGGLVGLPCGVHYGLHERRLEWGLRVRELVGAEFCSTRKESR